MPYPEGVTCPPPVRCAQASDLAALVRLENTCFRHERLSERQFRYHLHSPRAALLIVDNDTGQLLGYALLLTRVDHDIARLYSIALAPAARGRGLGGRLLDASEAMARARGCTRMRLEVRRHNRLARAMYRARGYQVIAHLPSYYANGADGLRLQKLLDRPPVTADWPD